MTYYEVVCLHPDGGDVIEGRAPAVRTQHDSLDEALYVWRRWHRDGPNGPERDADLLRDGQKVDPWEEIERLGMEPLGLIDCYGRWRLAGCRARVEGER